jgi:hypothetical protein
MFPRPKAIADSIITAQSAERCRVVADYSNQWTSVLRSSTIISAALAGVATIYWPDRPSGEPE